MKNEDILLVYDKECPLCDNYCQMVRIKQSVGNLVLVNAREDSQIMKEITELDLDIDQGMVLKMGEQIYYGSDAIHALALISSRSGLFNRLCYWMFKSKSVSSILYPFCRSLRNLLLKLLKVKKINNLRKEQSKYF